MSQRKIFTDYEGREIQAYINDADMMFIEAGHLGEDLSTGFVCLSKEDAIELANELLRLVNEME